MEQKITVPKGCKIESVDYDDNSVIIMFGKDKPKFKKGDFLKTILSNSNTIIIYDKEDELAYSETCLSIYNNNSSTDEGWNIGLFRLCTEQEKQEMLDYMHSNGVDWDDKNMEVVPYIWKPKEGEKYWLINRNGQVGWRIYHIYNGLDMTSVDANNCFKTEELAMPYAEEFKRILKERKL